MPSIFHLPRPHTPTLRMQRFLSFPPDSDRPRPLTDWVVVQAPRADCSLVYSFLVDNRRSVFFSPKNRCKRIAVSLQTAFPLSCPAPNRFWRSRAGCSWRGKREKVASISTIIIKSPQSAHADARLEADSWLPMGRQRQQEGLQRPLAGTPENA